MKKSLLIFVLAALLLPLQAEAQSDSDTLWTTSYNLHQIKNVLFSPDGERIFVSTGHGNIFVLDTETGSQLDIIENAGDVVAFSPDGQFIYTNAPYKLDSETYEIVQKSTDTLVLHSGRNGGYALSADGKYLFLALGNIHNPIVMESFIIVDTETLDHVHVVESIRSFKYVAVSPDNKYYVTVSHDVTTIIYEDFNVYLTLWDAQTFEMIKVLQTWENSGPGHLAFSPSGEYLSMCMGNKVKIYEIPEGSLIFEAEVTKTSVLTSCFSKDNSHIFIGTGRSNYSPSKIFNISSKEITYEYVFREDPYGVNNCMVSPDNALIIAGSIHEIYLLNAKWDPSGIDKEDNALQIKAYPVPSESGLILEYNLPKPRETKIFLIDTKGHENLLFEGFRDKGENEHRINTAEYPSGTYTLLIEYNGGLYSEKIIISK